MTTIGLRPCGERLLEDEPGLRERAFGGIDQHKRAVGHLQDALDLAAEVGVPGVSIRFTFTSPMRWMPQFNFARMVMPQRTPDRSSP